MAMSAKKLETLITEWTEADRLAAKYKATEMELRKQLFAELFPDPVEGAGNKIKVGHGMAIQATHKINRTIQKAEHDLLRQQENIAPIIAEVVSYKPELKVKEFKLLSPEIVKLIAPMITEKPGAPELELKDANKIRW